MVKVMKGCRRFESGSNPNPDFDIISSTSSPDTAAHHNRQPCLEYLFPHGSAYPIVPQSCLPSKKPTQLIQNPVCFRPAPSPKTPLPIHIQSAPASTLSRRRGHQDPYADAQSKQRKTANLARQAVLLAERAALHGDPVKGVPTPFLSGFDTVGTSASAPVSIAADGIQTTAAPSSLLNHFLTPSELSESLKHSKLLSEPVEPVNSDPKSLEDYRLERARHEVHHTRAAEALARIVSLANASQAEKTRANTRRCIEVFGRHNTDTTLRPRPATAQALAGKALPEKTPRAGPDTGSSEVQIAILTAKIRVLNQQMEAKKGGKDKINKRNLRVMVHKRQKLLRYLRGKERGGDRWQHLVEKLGLGDATWKGEISL